jgi:hypothetical protein
LTIVSSVATLAIGSSGSTARIATRTASVMDVGSAFVRMAMCIVNIDGHGFCVYGT